MSGRRRRVLALSAVLLLAAGGAWTGASRAAGREARPAPQRPFPHAEHVGLFPTCGGCHAGIGTGDTARWLTAGPEDCAECHDGTVEKKVRWTKPERPVTNLHFDHVRHARELEEGGAGPADCLDCHRQEGGTKPMQVVMARPELCLSCHAHRAPEHLALEARCSTCHEPLHRARALSAAQIADFPKPAWHDSASFLLEHGDLASAPDADCSTCHARQSCARCHLNASRVAAIQALPPDPRIGQLVAGRSGEWPEPPGHREPGWSLDHGGAARASLATCANCHAASSCATCHTGSRAGFLAGLPEVTPGGPPGVRVSGGPPGHGPGFESWHGVAAASGQLECSACHTRAQCTACHRGGVPSSPGLGAPPSPGAGDGGPTSLRPDDESPPEGPLGRPAATPARPRSDRAPGEASGDRGVVRFAAARTTRRWPARPLLPRPAADTTPPADTSGREGSAKAGGDGKPPKAGQRPPRTGGFHPPDYVLRHGADAFSRGTQCSECHNAQAFCLACHEKMGVGRGGPIGTQAYHDAEPDWLLVHGQAARQNMETCVSCHQQSSCLRCHSAKSGFRINPHGPGFDPDRISGRSTISCGICHYAIPEGGGGG